MAITVNLRYKGKNGSALAFAKEMTESGTVDLIRAEDGNLKYEYYQSSPMMQTIATLREKYDLHMTVERYISAETPETEEKFIRK